MELVKFEEWKLSGNNWHHVGNAYMELNVLTSLAIIYMFYSEILEFFSFLLFIFNSLGCKNASKRLDEVHNGFMFCF